MAWEKVVEKLILFLYPKNEHINIVITGLRNKISNKNKISGLIIDCIEPIASPKPSETKNIVAKKSLNGFILLAISIL